VSWAAHDLEPYAIQRHLGVKIAFVPLLIGSYAPDLATKWFVYGVTVFGFELKAEDTVRFHRGWPGAGFTHSLAFGVVISGAIFLLTKSKPWALGFLIGQWAHAITDVGDTVGTQLWFPFALEQVSIGAWAYAGELGRFTDAAAYFSGPGFVWDGVWIVIGLVGWRTMTRGYFLGVICEADSFWGKLRRHLPETALLALYRAAFFYGTTRWIAWLIWAHVLHSYPFDISWGGPHWVPAETSPNG